MSTLLQSGPAYSHLSPPYEPSDLPLRRTEPPTYAQRQWALGTGVMWFQGFEGKEGGKGIPMVTVDWRWAKPISEFIALERSFTIGLHDFKAIAEIYKWAFTGTKEDLVIKLGTGWMIFWAPPLAGANYTYCQGITYYSSEQTPNFHLSIGLSASLLFRFSNPDFIWDGGFGPYVGFGGEFVNGYGFSVRAIYSYPIYRSLIADEQINVVTVTGNMTFPF